MERNKLILSSVLAISIFCLGMISLRIELENFLFSEYYSQPVFFSASVYAAAQKRAEAEISAPVALSAKVAEESEKILFKKNIDREMPIASLTKLMTAWVIFEHPEYYSLKDQVYVSLEAVQRTGDCGLKEGESFPLNDFLHSMLIESCNDSAFAVAEALMKDALLSSEDRIQAFVGLMNLEAEKIGLENTEFLNPSGLDIKDQTFSNSSTARDLFLLAKAIQEKHPEIFEISIKKQAYIFNGRTAFNQNKILSPSIIGGKTGWTEAALGCILLVEKAEDGYFVHIVLGAESQEARFQEALKLIAKFSEQ